MNQESKVFLKKAFFKLNGVDMETQDEDKKKNVMLIDKLFEQFIILVDQRIQYDILKRTMDEYEKQLM